MACYSLKLKLSKDGDPLYVTEMKATSHFNKGRIVLDDDIKSQCLDWKHGSVIVYLRPLGKHAKETLAFFCRHGGMKHFVLDLLKKKDIFSSLPEGEITIQIQVCCYDEDSSSEVAGVQYGDHTQIVEEDPLSQYDSSTVTDNPKVIKQNLLLLYGYITEEIEPLQFQDTFVSRGVWDKSFFEQLKKTPRRRARANQFLEEVMNKGNTALEALVHALKISGNDDIANRLCCVRKISSEFMDEGQVDDSMIELVKEDSTAQAQEDMLWSCHLTVAVKKNDGTLASNVEGIRCPKCSKTFDSRPAMEAHQRDAHGPRRSLSEGISDEAKGHEDRKWKCACGKTFVNEAQLTQHRVAKKENAKPFQCPQCCHSYENQERLDAHKSSQHADLVRNDGSASQIVRRISSDGSSLRNQPMLPTGNKTYRCLQCIRLFSSSDALIAHEKAMNHDNSDIRGNKQKSLQRYLENYYRMKSEVNPDDKDTSFEFVRRNVLQILANVRKQEGGIIFKCELRNAGSNATELKIGKADEFDFNIPIDVKVLEVKREGTVPYIFKDKERKKMGEGPSSKNMNVKRELYYDPGGKFPIPKDYAVLVVDKGASSTLNDLCVENHLIPHHLQQKLHSCIREVIKGMDAIDLNAEAHGPAITMNMHPPDDHHISVDLTMIIDWKHITVKEYGWPRLETQQNLSRELIDTILAAGCQLTPKGDEFWNISFSNCESILMKEVDGPSECRKMCHKLLKSFFQTWRSRSKTGYKTISSFIFKHLMFWMNENYPQPGYWNKSNLSVCFLDTLRELLKSLNTKKLVNYFIPNENILGIRDVDEVNELTGEVKKEIQELENINC